MWHSCCRFNQRLWHLARTWAWAWCFPRPRTVSFLRLARVRLAAEAFSYLTLRGIAGEPLKVVLLADDIDPRIATAAVALERIGYMIGTTVIVGVGSIMAIVLLPLTPTWFRVFRAFAVVAGVVSALTMMALAGRDALRRWTRRPGARTALARDASDFRRGRAAAARSGPRQRSATCALTAATLPPTPDGAEA